MKVREIFIGLLLLTAVLTITGIVMTPLKETITAAEAVVRYYVVGGELDVPALVGASGGSGGEMIVALAIAAVALAGGVLVASKLK